MPKHRLLSRGYLDRAEIDAILAQAPLSVTENSDAPPVQTAQFSPASEGTPPETNIADDAIARSAALSDP